MLIPKLVHDVHEARESVNHSSTHCLVIASKLWKNLFREMQGWFGKSQRGIHCCVICLTGFGWSKMAFVLWRSRILAVIWVIRMERVRSCGMQLFIGFLFQLLLGVFIVGLSSFWLDWKASLFWEFSTLGCGVRYFLFLYSSGLLVCCLFSCKFCSSFMEVNLLNRK